MKGRFWYEDKLSVFPTPFIKHKNIAMEKNFSQYLVEKKIRSHYFNRNELIEKTIEKWIKEEKHPSQKLLETLKRNYEKLF